MLQSHFKKGLLNTINPCVYENSHLSKVYRFARLDQQRKRRSDIKITFLKKLLFSLRELLHVKFFLYTINFFNMQKGGGSPTLWGNTLLKLSSHAPLCADYHNHGLTEEYSKGQST